MLWRSLMCSLLALAAGFGQEASPPLAMKTVAGGWYARATFISSTGRLEGHLLIDLSNPAALTLHSRSAGVLELGEGDLWVAVEVDGVRLGSYYTEVTRLQGLEQVTAEHAAALEEVPAIAILGWPAFAKGRTLFDPSQGRFQRLGPSDPADPDRLPVFSPEEALTTVAGEVARGTRFALALVGGETPTLAAMTSDGAELRAALWTSGQDTWAKGDLRPEAKATLRLGPLAIAGYAALRRGAPPGFAAEAPVALGTGLLGRFAWTLDPVAGRVEAEAREEPLNVDADRALFAALEADDFDALEDWLNKHLSHRLAEESAIALLNERFQDRTSGADALEEALLLRVRAAPVRRRARTAMDLAERLKEADPRSFAQAKKPLFDLALKASAQDENAETVHRVRSEIGAIHLEAGDLDEAWKHLLGAAFGLPRDGLVNYRLGRLYERQGRLERAWSRYLQAAVTEVAGAEGLNGLKRLARESGVKTPFDVSEMKRALEGRVPAFQPASRHRPEPEAPPAGRVLVELFTGAQCPPCYAADLAVDGALAHFGPHAVIVQHHLPIPSPEPLVSPTAMKRAEALQVGGTPTVVLNGRIPVEDVGGRTQVKVEPSFRALKAAIETELKSPARFDIALALKADNRKLQVEATLSGTAEPGMKLVLWLVERAVLFPGKNQIAFHHNIVRADLSAGGIRLDGRAGAPITAAIDLEDLAQTLDEFLARSFGADAFALVPLDLPLDQLGVVAVLFDKNGAAVQCALQWISPKAEEDE